MVTETLLFLILKLRRIETSHTKKSAKTWVTVWTTWVEEKGQGYSPDIVSHEAKELYEKLQKFIRRGEKKG